MNIENSLENSLEHGSENTETTLELPKGNILDRPDFSIQEAEEQGEADMILQSLEDDSSKSLEQGGGYDIQTISGLRKLEKDVKKLDRNELTYYRQAILLSIKKLDTLVVHNPDNSSPAERDHERGEYERRGKKEKMKIDLYYASLKTLSVIEKRMGINYQK